MFDDDDELQPAERRAPGVPALPAELKAKLFDYVEGPALRYPGPDVWPQRIAMGAPGGFTEWVNPSKRKVRMVFNLGPDAQLHIGFEMRLIPERYRISRDLVGELTRAKRALRPEYCHLVVEIPAGGTLAIPAEFDRAIRLVRDGIVVSGACPWLVKKGEAPPEIHAALMPEDDSVPAFVSAPAAARRLS